MSSYQSKNLRHLRLCHVYICQKQNYVYIGMVDIQARDVYQEIRRRRKEDQRWLWWMRSEGSVAEK